jgi:hypothetical protein
MAKQNEATDIENKNQVVISPEDAQECAKFFQFFEIPIPEKLQKAIENFAKDPVFVNQDELKFWLGHTVSFSEHPVFKDEVFSQVRPETREVTDEMAFSRELESQLMTDDEPKKG